MDISTLVQMAQAVSVAAETQQQLLAQAEAERDAAEASWQQLRGSGATETQAAVEAAVDASQNEGRAGAATIWMRNWLATTPGEAELRARQRWERALREAGEAGATLDLLEAEHNRLVEGISELAALQKAGEEAYNRARAAERQAIIEALTATADEDSYTPPEGVEGVEKWRGLVERWFPERLVEEAMTIMWCESRGNPDAKHPESDATGLFQFLPSTWEWVSKEAGVAGARRENPVANTRAAAWLVAYSERTNHPAGRWGHWECRSALN